MSALRSKRQLISHDSALDVSIDYDTVSDVELVTFVAQGSQGALAEIYSRHGSSVYALARWLCPGEAAKDVTHEVFLALWQSPEFFELHRGTLRSHLLAVAHRCAVSCLRSADNRSSEQERDTSFQLYEKGSAALALHADGGVRARLAGLSDHQRQAVLLTYFGGYTYGQVADRLHRSEGTVRTDIEEALTCLRAKIVVG